MVVFLILCYIHNYTNTYTVVEKFVNMHKNYNSYLVRANMPAFVISVS